MDEVTMCQNGNGRIGYAMVLVEVNAKCALQDNIEITYKDKENRITGVKNVKVETP
ncbi:hypothetical protein Tco_0577333, partial [Tanacetum coccineum]